MKEQILSVGIDIGTSTTQLIFSRLTIVNLASSYTVPRISIVDKEVIYKSAIYFTPLKSQTEIDGDRIGEIIRQEYSQSRNEAGGSSDRGCDHYRRDSQKNQCQYSASDFKRYGRRVCSGYGRAGSGVCAFRQRRRGQTSSLKKRGRQWPISISEEAPAILLPSGKAISREPVAWISEGRLIKIENGKISYIYPKIRELADRHGIRICEGDPADGRVLYGYVNIWRSSWQWLFI